MSIKKIYIKSNEFASESHSNFNRVKRSWDMTIGMIGNNSGVIIRFDGDKYRNTPLLRSKGIRICEECGYIQPWENLLCKNCGEETLETDK